MITILFQIVLALLNLYWWAVILAAVISMLISFNVLDTRNRLVWSIADFLDRVTEPALRPIRRVLPSFGAVDLSPFILLILIYATNRSGAPPRRHRLRQRARPVPVSGFWRPAADGVSVAVKVQPKSRRPGVQGRAPAVEGKRLRIGVSEAAEDGRANRAVCATLARALALPASAVAVVAGMTCRDKTLRVAGDPATIGARLEAL